MICSALCLFFMCLFCRLPCKTLIGKRPHFGGLIKTEGEDRKIYHTATLKRSYRDSAGEWKEAGTVSLSPQNIPDVILTLQKSFEFLRMGLRDRRKETSAESQEQQEFAAEGTSDQAAFTDRVGKGSRKGR